MQGFFCLEGQFEEPGLVGAGRIFGVFVESLFEQLFGQLVQFLFQFLVPEFVFCQSSGAFLFGGHPTLFKQPVQI